MKEFSIERNIVNGKPLLTFKFCMGDKDAEVMLEKYKKASEKMFEEANEKKLVKSYFYSYADEVIDAYNSSKKDKTFEEFFDEFMKEKMK